MKKKNDEIKKTYGDRIFMIINTILVCVSIVIFTYPMWFVLIASISNSTKVALGEVLIFPKGINVESYKEMFKHSLIWSGYGNTVFYTLLGTFLNVVLTVCAAYPLSRKDFVCRKFLLVIFLFTMYFSGGLIPTYLVVKKLNITNTIWAMILPSLVSIYNVIITRTYFMNSIPESLQEAATLDGANSAQYLVKVVVPLSKPILAVITLYYAIGHWNDFYSALVYLSDEKLFPLQLVLREILLGANADGAVDPAAFAAKKLVAQSLKYSTIVASTVPVLCVYPFVQKQFVKGIMIGSIKG